MQAGVRVRAAEARDVAALPGIERRAAELFVAHAVPASELDETRTPEELRAALARGDLWVAVDAADAPIGFALCTPLEGSLHLEEIDVDPEHGRRGVGAALVSTARRISGGKFFARMVSSSAKILARSRAFCSWRTLPGQL